MGETNEVFQFCCRGSLVDPTQRQLNGTGANDQVLKDWTQTRPPQILINVLLQSMTNL